MNAKAEVYYAGLPRYVMKVGQKVVAPFRRFPTEGDKNDGVKLIDLYKRTIVYLPGTVLYASPNKRWVLVQLECHNGKKIRESYFIEDLLEAAKIYNKLKGSTAA